MLKFRLFIRIIAGILLATLFNANAEEPSTGHFGFQERAPSMLSERFVTLRVQLAGKMPNDDDENQAIGVNVYWKTKNKNILQGRTFDSSLMPNLPRELNSFYSVNYFDEHLGDTPNAENIEMIFFVNGFAETGSLENTDLKEALYLDEGCEPSPGYFYTQFYYYRFPNNGYEVGSGGSGYDCNNNGNFTIKKEKEDPEVAITSFAFTFNDDICNVLNTDKKTAACVGWKKNNASTLLTKDILIPSNKLDFLIIEVISFSYNTNKIHRTFSAHPVQVLRFVSDSAEKGKMNLSIADGKDRGSDDGFMNKGPNFNQFGASPSRARLGDPDKGYGYYSWDNSNYYKGQGYTEECPQNDWTVDCDYDFVSLDSLTVSLSYADPNRLPSVKSPSESGIGIQLTATYLDENCQKDSRNCQYPRPKNP